MRRAGFEPVKSIKRNEIIMTQIYKTFPYHAAQMLKIWISECYLGLSCKIFQQSTPTYTSGKICDSQNV